MYDDGVNAGDLASGDGIWTGEQLFASGSASSQIYKYAIMADYVDTLNNGNGPLDNEAGFGMNHLLQIDDTNQHNILPPDIFGSQWRNIPAVVHKPVDNILPAEFSMEQNYPNPFNPSTEISYALPKEVQVNLSVYNSVGQKISTLVNTKQSAGKHFAIWLGIDQNGNKVTSGVYFYRIEAGDFISMMKMLFIK